MVSTNQNFTIYAGDTNNVLVGIEEDDIAASLTGASAVWILSSDIGSGSLVRITSDDFLSISGSTVTIAISPSHTSSLAGKYYHELEVTDSSGNVSTTTTGVVTIKKSGANL